ncbi:MAG TPA: plastocyanin/azurin family copper-binding protein [Gaiellaceae bacterium]|nr:plastocyanin/azurin family copper-binding protein [Gaiellaceae bacterium]
MNRRHLTLAILLLVLGLALAGCGGDDDDGGEAAATTEATTGGDTGGGDTGGTAGGGTTLNGSVGPGFTISLDGTDGITAGGYTIAVNDQSSEHNFHLTGPGGVDVATDVSDEGEESFDVTLEPGEYTFVCDPHASQMNGSFTVG